MASKPNDVKKSEVTTAERKTPKPGELPKLFKAYEDADKEVRVLEEGLARAITARSAAVRAIGEFGTGPYDYKGKLLTVTSRKNEEAFNKLLDEGVKEEEAKERATRFFFKSTGEQNITKVA